MKLINRNEYLNHLISWKDKQIIKVVSGIRRSGKSTLFDLYENFLLSVGVKPYQIIKINFEDVNYEYLTDYRTLYDYICKRLNSDKMNYIFLDEIQHVASFEKAVDSLFIKLNCDLYITGSNAYFMSGELATLLSGRYIELKMLPLSFKEYCDGLALNYPESVTLSKEEKYNFYTTESSFPYTLNLHGRQKEINNYLEGLFSTVLLKDISKRHKISDVKMLESVIKFVFDNIGNTLSTTKIANTMTSNGRKIDVKTVEKYLTALCDSLIAYEVNRYNIKGKSLLATLDKYYVADISLRKLFFGNNLADQGHLLENTVYLELLRRGYKVYIGYMPDSEVDFVAQDNDATYYYQVAASVLDPSTLERELSSLNKIQDNFPKYLLTLDTIGANSSHNGIKQLNVLEWLLN